ncbi:hypothetical protein MTO96_035071 [Rhipicephalus appendiculatus]
MEYEQNSTPGVVKRPLEVNEGNDNGTASAGEPLPKAPFVRRPTLKIQPKVLPDRRSASSAEKRHHQQTRLSGYVGLRDFPTELGIDVQCRNLKNVRRQRENSGLA